MHDALIQLVPALGAALLHFVWQGSLLGLLAALVLAQLGNARPQTRYAVTCVALLVALLLPILTLAWQILLPATTSTPVSGLALGTATSAIASATQPAAWPSLAAGTPARIANNLPWLVACWAAGAGALSLRMFAGLYWVARLRQRAWADSASTWQVSANRLAVRLGLRGTVPVRLSNDTATPLAVGWWRPMVLLPASLALHMPASLLEALIAHELAHIRRHDYLVNLLQGVAETLLFYHPVVWWLSRRIRNERELIADALAANALGDSRRLALALSELDRSFDTPTPSPCFAPAAQGGQLMSRIQHLLRPRTTADVSARLLPLLGLPVIGLALAGAGLYAHANTPQTAPAAHPSHSARPMPPPPPPAPPAPPELPAPPARPAPPAPPPPKNAVGIAFQHGGDGYAVVRKGEARYILTGDQDDMRMVKKIRSSADGDFLLVRKGKQHFVLRDTALLAQIEAVWAPLDPLNNKMEALQATMQPHQQRMHELQAEMDRQAAPQPSPEMDTASAQLDALATRQDALAAQQAALAQRARKTSNIERDDLERQMDRLSAQIEAINVQIEAQSAIIESQSKTLQQQSMRMQAVGSRMQAASQPMQAIGKDMQAVGMQIEHAAHKADSKTRQLIDNAFARGLAQPVA